MKFHFYKYQATGNDFILIDNRSGELTLSADQISRLCDRRFGIGADGVILISPDASADFNVDYYNSDGSQSLCGNGSRAAVMFASHLGMTNGKARFSAYDGIHEAELEGEATVRLRMNDVTGCQRIDGDFLINTGSPHYIRFQEGVETFPVVEEGRAIRYSEPFREKGVNVNFVELREGNTIFVRTYERGVEDETLSCGTGVTAAALAASFQGLTSPVTVLTRGGTLRVEFKSGQSDTFRDIFLIGPAKMVFEGKLEL
ncbi:MAG TPA: diaminopimelate epimerase [Cyclobacteriaceae bacterium]|nr:diaminopimelate epimerase [Cyclobacteriaceae bacterium]